METIVAISDLHLEFGSEPFIDLPDGDILVLAGDIALAVLLQEHRNDAEARKHKKACKRFFARIAQKNYKKVIAIIGNHECYNFTFAGAEAMMRELYAANNIVFLHNETYETDDWEFFGGPLWTDMGKSNPLVMMQAEMYVTDYRRIFHENGTVCTPYDTVTEHFVTKIGIEDFLRRPKTKKGRCVITHHLPTYQSIDPQYNDPITNGAYASELWPLVVESDVWIHGHTHLPTSYMLGDCQVVCNPYGYHSRGHNVKLQDFVIGVPLRLVNDN